MPQLRENTVCTSQQMGVTGYPWLPSQSKKARYAHIKTCTYVCLGTILHESRNVLFFLNITLSLFYTILWKHSMVMQSQSNFSWHTLLNSRKSTRFCQQCRNNCVCSFQKLKQEYQVWSKVREKIAFVSNVYYIYYFLLDIFSSLNRAILWMNGEASGTAIFPVSI